jgi:hypothetical protein
VRPQAATEFYRLQQRVNAETRVDLRRLWRRMGTDFEASWDRLGGSIYSTIAAAQLELARASVTYLDDLADQTTPAPPEGALVPEAFAGIASDGRDLAALSYGAVVKAGEAVNAGATRPQALRVGGSWLDLMGRLQVADAARIATGAGAAARPGWGGYVRVLTPPSCSRCAVLGGKFFRWNTGFQRHPKCDCQHFPSSNEAYARAEGFITNPDDAWRAGQIKDLTKAQQDALENGADISQVINARRGMSTTDIGGRRVRVTNEGATRRGVFGSSSAARRAGSVTSGAARQQGAVAGYIQRRTALARLTPEAIYRASEGDRDLAIRLLRRFGYIT